MRKKVAVIMAGGWGTKFWPRSTENTPKQYIHLIGQGTLIQNTYLRIKDFFPDEDIYVVSPEIFREQIELQLPEIPIDNIIIEPFGRNTAPCLALSHMLLKRKYAPDTIMTAFASDHVIGNLGEFHSSLEIACNTAYELKGIVTLGIKPKRPETQFGYVQIREEEGQLGEFYELGVRYSTTFAEKPDEATAKRFVDSGDFLWNSGIFTWRFDTFDEALQSFLPDHYSFFSSIETHIDKDTFAENLEIIYQQMNSISVDYGILEKAKNVYVVISNFRWSDLSNWDELYRLSMKDASNNVIEGDVISINTKNCLIISQERLIGTVGIENLIVIDSGDSLLICRRGHSEDVKEVVDHIKRKHIQLLG